MKRAGRILLGILLGLIGGFLVAAAFTVSLTLLMAFPLRFSQDQMNRAADVLNRGFWVIVVVVWGALTGCFLKYVKE